MSWIKDFITMTIFRSRESTLYKEKSRVGNSAQEWKECDQGCEFCIELDSIIGPMLFMVGL